MNTEIHMDQALQSGIAAITESLGEYPTEQQLLIATKCSALLNGYHARWKDAGYQAEDIERFVSTSLVNPDTGRASRSFQVGGKLDLIATAPSGERVLIDHKTTSLDIQDPNAPYWRQLAVEGQINHYALLLWLNGEKVDSIVWDVTRKPTISPKKLSKANRKAIASLGKYCDQQVSEATQRYVVNAERENLELYGIRLTHDCIHERPQWYFQRQPQPRLDVELLEYARELWSHGQDLLTTRQHERHTKNPGACMLYGSPCKFLGICSGHDIPESDKWQQKDCLHNELSDVLEDDGKDLLTNSRIRTFQTCKRKHFFEYELGIERQDEDEKEALYFGRLYHKGLDSWWSEIGGEYYA